MFKISENQVKIYTESGGLLTFAETCAMKVIILRVNH